MGDNMWDKMDENSSQKKLENARKKQNYKNQAEKALDHIVRDYQNAKDNSIKNWKLDVSEKSSVVRYWKKYWNQNFFKWSVSVLILTFIVSFYSIYAIIGIGLVATLREIYSQNFFMIGMLNDHDLTKKETIEIKDKIFQRQMKSSVFFIVAILLMLFSYGSYFFTKSILLTKYLSSQKVELTVDILSKFHHFKIENELFAYVNVASILTLMLLKLYEKWSK